MNSIQHTAIILAPYLGVEQDVTRLILKNKTSSASDKLQIRPMMETLIELGVDTRAISLNKYFQISNLETLRQPDLCFISKLRSHPSENSNVYAMFHQACVLHLKRKGSQIITLYSDHLAFLKEADGELYSNILFLSDAIIAPTTTLANHAKLWALPDTSTFTIRDPCLIKEHPFQPFSEQENCRVLWFGSNSNIQYLQSTLPDIISNSPRNRTFELTYLASEEGIKEIQTTCFDQYSKSMELPSNCLGL